MDDRVQARALLGVGENLRGQRLAVDCAVFSEQLLAEGRDHIGVRRAAGDQQLARHQVEVEGGAAALGQPPQHAALPAHDPARQPHAQHW
ncbi:MAG TPA: hypothetical protein VGR82_05795 [Methylomirabilota bacterium]|nr:hypothetical protein [Methylomirabilota bacterium]